MPGGIGGLSPTPVADVAVRQSRRRFVASAAGVAGAALAAPAWVPGVAEAHGRKRHRCVGRPIPGGIQPLLPADSTVFHVFPPGHGADGKPLEPSTVTDFAGLVGLVVARGTGTETDKRTGTSRRLFWEADLRFMDGHICDDDRCGACTFVFTWLDVYTTDQFDPSVQIHDFNPGIAKNGLFWTTPAPKEVVQHDRLPDRRARLTMNDVAVEDYHDVINAFKDGPSEEATVSFDVSWARGGTLFNLCDETTTFEGTVRETTATVQWTGQTDAVRFDADMQTETVIALVGHEDNGVFFDCEAGDV
jgi:hypothetical protein